MTVKQQQCLLVVLGFDPGEIDGIWGNQTKAAAVQLQKSLGLTADGVFGAATEKAARQAVAAEKRLQPEQSASGTDFWSGVRYFRRGEFACKCGGKSCGGFPAEPSERLVKLADQVRDHFGKPAVVSSGLRCAAHNAAVGGVANSRHLTGRAMDFSISGVSGQELLGYVQSLGVHYAYQIGGGAYVHMDVD